jgi:hypothetical protein
MNGLIPNPWIILAFVLALIGAYGYGEIDGEGRGGNRVQLAWDHADKVATAAREKRNAQVRAESAALQAAADERRRKEDERNKDRDRQLAAALDELRKRPQRPSPTDGGGAGAPGAPPERGGCTGAGLYADDAMFLTRFADQAQRIRGQRDDFRLRYEQARDALARLKASSSSAAPATTP